MIQTALIGIGGYGKFYLSQLIRLQSAENIRLQAAVVRHEKGSEEEIRILKETHCTIYSTPEKMFYGEKGKLDFCCIPTGIDSHKELTLSALQQGCHVLVEKPAAATIQDIKAMISAQKLYKKIVLVGYQNIYNQDVQKIKKSILEQSIGKLKEIRMKAMWPRSLAYFNRNKWAGKLKHQDKWVLDSPANNAYIHHLNLMCFWSGDKLNTSSLIESVQAEMYRSTPIESFDTFCARFKTSTGIKLLYLGTHSCCDNENPSIEIIGTEGKILWTHSGYEIRRKDGLLDKFETGDLDRSRVEMFNSVAEILNGKKKMGCSLEIAYTPTFCVNAMHMSSKIENISASHCSVSETKHGRQIGIHQIENIIHKAYREGRLFSELGVSWAKNSKLMDCRDLNTFNLESTTSGF